MGNIFRRPTTDSYKGWWNTTNSSGLLTVCDGKGYAALYSLQETGEEALEEWENLFLDEGFSYLTMVTATYMDGGNPYEELEVTLLDKGYKMFLTWVNPKSGNTLFFWGKKFKSAPKPAPSNYRYSPNVYDRRGAIAHAVEYPHCCGLGWVYKWDKIHPKPLEYFIVADRMRVKVLFYVLSDAEREGVEQEPVDSYEHEGQNYTVYIHTVEE